MARKAKKKADPTLTAMRETVAALAPLYSADVTSVAEACNLSVRHVQRLVADGTMPAPSKHGCYALPDCARAFGLYNAGVEIPATFGAAVLRFIEAKDVLETFLRRHPGQRPEHYTRPECVLWPLRPLDPILPPQRLDLRAASDIAVCAVLGVSGIALDAVASTLGTPRRM